MMTQAQDDPEYPLRRPACPVDASHRIAGRGPAWGAVEWRCLDCTDHQLLRQREIARQLTTYAASMGMDGGQSIASMIGALPTLQPGDLFGGMLK